MKRRQLIPSIANTHAPFQPATTTKSSRAQASQEELSNIHQKWTGRLFKGRQARGRGRTTGLTVIINRGQAPRWTKCVDVLPATQHRLSSSKNCASQRTQYSLSYQSFIKGTPQCLQRCTADCQAYSMSAMFIPSQRTSYTSLRKYYVQKVYTRTPFKNKYIISRHSQ